jgi:hypothetical protein
MECMCVYVWGGEGGVGENMANNGMVNREVCALGDVCRGVFMRLFVY